MIEPRQTLVVSSQLRSSFSPERGFRTPDPGHRYKTPEKRVRINASVAGTQNDKYMRIIELYREEVDRLNYPKIDPSDDCFYVGLEDIVR